MALLVVNQGKVKLLQELIDNYLGTLRLRLFKNDHVPVATDTEANFTEANFDGYLAIILNNWGNAFLNGASEGETDEVNRTFTCTGATVANTIYGYYVTDNAGFLLWAERNPAGGFLINAAGQTYTVLPRFNDQSPI